MDPAYVLSELTSREDYENQLVVSRKLSSRRAVYGELARPLSAPLAQALSDAGIDRLFRHQVEAVDLLRRGVHAIIATGTASGKSLCYQLPVAEALHASPDATALYLSPTKALAQDQLRGLERLGLEWLAADIYDGDTPSNARAAVRRHANLVLSNPDMLHVGILPHHALWARFLRGLRYVVVDEAHVLRGVFGSHVALVLRRLRRVAARYRAQPVFAFASATIGNPAEHASALCGLPVEMVTADGSPKGQRYVAFWNPPFRTDAADGRRQSSNYEAAKLLASLVRHDARTLAFSKTRVSAELVARYARDRLPEPERDGVAAYRAGYLAAERREVEAGLQSGGLQAVSATNALELGIDVGGLDAVVLNGFPGTVASAWQQAGRAGRAGQESLAVIVPQDEPLDQFYASHPNEFFAKPHEAALVNPENPHILKPHVGCAAYESPLEDGDAAVFGERFAALVKELEDGGILRDRRGRRYWSHRTPPAQDVDIRSAGGSPFRIVEAGTGRMIGTVDAARAYSTVHPGAIYLHQGDNYFVRSLLLEDGVALAELTDVQEYTQAKSAMDLVVLHTEQAGRIGDVELCTGLVEVTEQVVAYQRKRLPGGEVIDAHELDMPPQSLVTRAVWYILPEDQLHEAMARHDGDDVLLGSLHAAEHAAIGILPVFAMCDRWDIGGLSTNLHADTDAPTIFIYDGYPMGAGIAEHAFEVVVDHLSATRAHVNDCPCESGCPACVQSPKCGNWNEPLHKRGAVDVLDLILGRNPARGGG